LSNAKNNVPFKLLNSCIACGKEKFVDVLDLGEQYIIDFLESDQESGNFKAPLDLVLCPACGLVQLRHIVSRDLMYRKYWYRSGISPAMCRELADITKSAEEIIKLKSGDIVVDIGANDGTLLRTYSRRDLRFVGFEPAVNLAEMAKDAGTIINDYFNAAAFKRTFPNERAMVITAIAMFYDLEDPNAFLSDIKNVLHPEGVFIVQMNYLGTMLDRNTFDNVCHEHLAYYSLRTFQSLLNNNGLEAFHVELNDVNGGSFRAYIRHKGHAVGGPATKDAEELMKSEIRNGLQSIDAYTRFAANVRLIAAKLHDFVSDETGRGKKIYVLGASTRGNTILQFARLSNQMITAAADRNPDKWGRKIIGTGIPIISKQEARKATPDYFLVLPYGFLDEIKSEEREYLKGGGKLIVPIPAPRIVTENGEDPI